MHVLQELKSTFQWIDICADPADALVLRQEEVVAYEDQVVWAKILAKYQEDEFWEKGLERYLADLVEAMLAGALLPPAVVYGKRLVDGYHRTNAAVLGGASVIPFIQANT